MKNEQLCINFVNGNVNIKKGNNMYISHDGTRLYSFDTCIAERLSNDYFIINATKYSVTTSKHQTYLRRAIGSRRHGYTNTKVPFDANDLMGYIIL